MTTKSESEDKVRLIGIRLTEDEIDAVQELTKVDAVAPAVVSIVRKFIDQQTKAVRSE